ncbi:preprotein translocase subunit YajC [Arenibacter sp. GZD96]|uniref:preprotein translocase subunit YajC n=1 Tax=Aurantibrevibacter litoralis TaxID=3106030 RepID=UPI002AFF72B2|nr:preprotein translocase subunit YajC [Arenibacter sp. GZD-96]MEA1787053.1 preprotein translocase subunit YajC [Arenibacter sp. GZD-96]
MFEQYPFLPLILIFVVFFVFIILPQRKRQKEEKNFMNTLKRGDKVITKSGMHGKIVDLNDADFSCILETMAGKIKFDRSSISMELSKKLNAPEKK